VYAVGKPVEGLIGQLEGSVLRDTDKVRAALGRAGAKWPLIVLVTDRHHEESTAA
jgi:hypothetical protein